MVRKRRHFTRQGLVDVGSELGTPTAQVVKRLIDELRSIRVILRNITVDGTCSDYLVCYSLLQSKLAMTINQHKMLCNINCCLPELYTLI